MQGQILRVRLFILKPFQFFHFRFQGLVVRVSNRCNQYLLLEPFGGGATKTYHDVRLGLGRHASGLAFRRWSRDQRLVGRWMLVPGVNRWGCWGSLDVGWARRGRWVHIAGRSGLVGRRGCRMLVLGRPLRTGGFGGVLGRW